MPTGLMTSRLVNDELMSRRVCHITIIPSSHVNDLDNSRQGKMRDGPESSLCGSRQAAISRNFQKIRISGRNAKSLWFARLGRSNLLVKNFGLEGNPEKNQFSRHSRVMAGQKSSPSGPAKARTRQPRFLRLTYFFQM
ncbi:hypothetical protein PDIG_11910 [Penicillium digitatum PHI26]|uniref:Uncharacterized protein n=1 Tax=Penicillium digitatum (strain PHI26 / CECT 20796) TaxID=1170229 RepID=K9G7S7_PEND2|nr:hypothetical protein PDIG_11910 [Penicillium digitatum PHI26]